MKQLSITYERQNDSQVVRFYAPGNLANHTPYSCALNSSVYDTLHNYSGHYLEWTSEAAFMAFGRSCGNYDHAYTDDAAALIKRGKIQYLWYDMYNSRVDGLVVNLPDGHGLTLIKLSNFNNTYDHVSIPVWSNIRSNMSQAKNYPYWAGSYGYNQAVSVIRAGFGNISVYMDLGVDIIQPTIDIMITNTISVHITTETQAGYFRLVVEMKQFNQSTTPLATYDSTNKVFTLKNDVILASIIIPGSYDCRCPIADGENTGYDTSTYSIMTPDKADFVEVADVLSSIYHQREIDNVVSQYPTAIAYLNNKMAETVTRVDNIEVDIDGGFYSAV